MDEMEKINKAIYNKDRNSLANEIVSLYNRLGIKIPGKINICRPLPDDDFRIESCSDLYNWFKNDRDRELVIINDDVYKLYYERYYHIRDDFVGYNLTMEHIGKISG